MQWRRGPRPVFPSGLLATTSALVVTRAAVRTGASPIWLMTVLPVIRHPGGRAPRTSCPAAVSAKSPSPSRNARISWAWMCPSSRATSARASSRSAQFPCLLVVRAPFLVRCRIRLLRRDCHKNIEYFRLAGAHRKRRSATASCMRHFLRHYK